MYMIENRNVVLVDDIKRKLLVVYGYSLLIRWKKWQVIDDCICMYEYMFFVGDYYRIILMFYNMFKK